MREAVLIVAALLILVGVATLVVCLEIALWTSGYSLLGKVALQACVAVVAGAVIGMVVASSDANIVS